MSSFNLKYLKYKNKYLQLKNKIGGSASQKLVRRAGLIISTEELPSPTPKGNIKFFFTPYFSALDEKEKKILKDLYKKHIKIKYFDVLSSDDEDVIESREDHRMKNAAMNFEEHRENDGINQYPGGIIFSKKTLNMLLESNQLDKSILDDILNKVSPKQSLVSQAAAYVPGSVKKMFGLSG